MNIWSKNEISKSLNQPRVKNKHAQIIMLNMLIDAEFNAESENICA